MEYNKDGFAIDEQFINSNKERLPVSRDYCFFGVVM